MRKEYNIHLDYSVPLGAAYSSFMENLREKKLVGNRCVKCDRLYVPVRPFCDICCDNTTAPFEVEQTGEIIAYTVYCLKSRNLPEPPFAQAIIKIDGAANSLLHFIGGIDFSDAEDLKGKIRIGMRVKPEWTENRTGDILDIRYFKPA